MSIFALGWVMDCRRFCAGVCVVILFPLVGCCHARSDAVGCTCKENSAASVGACG
jgi:hypothetical protein